MGAPDLISLAASRRALADSVVIDNPRARVAHATFDFLVEHGKLRASGSKRAVLLAAPSQTGKSTILNSYAERKNTPAARKQRRIPVLVVTLEANVTRKGLAQNILEAMEEHGYQTGSNSGSETILLQRVRCYLAEARVELLILDEIHHLIHSENQKFAKSVSETIKRMLIKGICPIVLAGTEDARRLPEANSQLMQRCEPPIDLKPLKITNPKDAELFMCFLRDYIAELEKVGAVRGTPELGSDEIAARILEVSQGVLGAACNLIKDAIHLATLAGRDVITHEDLSIATDRSFVATGLYDRNPFANGLRVLRVVRS